jgi:hypothetical protein
MSDLTVRPLRTAFDPADGPVTVATPSCCCSCCCCCLATTALAMSSTLSAAVHASEARRRPNGGAVVLSLTAVPAAIAAMVAAANVGLVGLTVIAGVLAYAGVCALMFVAAGVEGEDLVRAGGIGLALGVGFARLVVVEAVVAIFTLFLVEVLALATLFLGWRVGRWWAGSQPRPDSPWQQQW